MSSTDQHGWAPKRPSSGHRALEEVEEFLAAHVTVRDQQKRELGTLLEHGDPEAVAARVARLATRLDASRGRDRVASEALALLEDPAALAPMAARLLGEDIAVSPYLERLALLSGLPLGRAIDAIAGV